MMSPLNFNRQFFFNKYKPIALKQEASVFKVSQPLDSQNQDKEEENNLDQTLPLDKTDDIDLNQKNDQKETQENNDKIDEENLLNSEPK